MDGVVPDWLVQLGAVCGVLGFGLALFLGIRQIIKERAARIKGQILATTMSAEFLGLVEGTNTPVCRVTCHNGSSAPLYDVYAHVEWYAVTQWPDDEEPGLHRQLDIIGIFKVDPNSTATNEMVCSGSEVLEVPQLPTGPFPVHFTCTDAHGRRWEKRLDGSVRRNPVEILGERETLQGGLTF